MIFQDRMRKNWQSPLKLGSCVQRQMLLGLDTNRGTGGWNRAGPKGLLREQEASLTSSEL